MDNLIPTPEMINDLINTRNNQTINQSITSNPKDFLLISVGLPLIAIAVYLIFLLIKKLIDKNKINAMIIYPNNQIKIKKLKYESILKIENKSYIVNKDNLIYHNSECWGIWLYNNPENINLLKLKNNETITSEALKTILENKLIKELVSSSNADKLILIIMVLIILNTIISFVIVNKILKLK